MLQKIVIGWEDIEDVFLANLAIKKPFILMGRHGICKTTVAREIAKIYRNHDDSHFRFYDATKDDLISIAGIPMPEELKKGRLTFSEHDRSIWKAKIIVVDEISRANKENQNLWLEILEEHTCFGKKLVYSTFIASLPYSEKIWIIEDNLFKSVKIGELVEKYQDKKEHDVYTFSFNPKSEQIEKTKITGFLKHKSASKIYHFTTKSGREVSVTGSHSLLKLTPAGIQLRKAASLKIGDEILSVNKICSSSFEESIACFRDIEISTEVAWLLGFFCAEGSAFIHKRQTGLLKNGQPKISKASIVSFSNKNRKLLDKTARIIQKTFNLKMGFIQDKRTGVWNLTISNPELYEFFSTYCNTNKPYIKGRKGYRKQVPEFIFNSPKIIIRHFLDGYLLGDGCKVHPEILAWSSVSKELRDGVASLFRLFGKKVKVYQYCDNRRNRQQNYLGYIRNAEGDSSLSMLEEFRSISNEKITKIDILLPEDWVYDLEVRNGKDSRYDTFLSQDWILLHNTMNPETYASTFTIDEALLDRFYAILPVPDFQKARATQLEEVIRLNFSDRTNGDAEITAIKENLVAIEETYKELQATEQFFSGVTEFVATFFEALLSQRQFAQEIYLSPRKAIQVTSEILAITAAQMVLKNQELGKILAERAALKALTYTIAIPLQLPEDKIRELFEQLKPTLFRFNLSPADKIRLELGKLDQKEVYQFFLKNNAEIQEHLEKDEVEKLIGELSQSEVVAKSEILNFYGAISEMDGLEEWKRKIFGVIIKNVHGKLSNFCINLQGLEIVDAKGVKLFASIQEFLDSFKTIPFPQANTEFLLDNDFSGSDVIRGALGNFVKVINY